MLPLIFQILGLKKKHHKRRIIQSEFLNRLSLIMSDGSLLFIKSDVEELYHYMNSVISNSLIFEEVKNKNLNYQGTFNPSKIKTEREKYAISKRLSVYQTVYKK